MSEPKFFPEDEVKEMRSKHSKSSARWGKLFDESNEQSKDAVLDLGLLLTYLMKNLKDDSYIEKCIKMLESEQAIEIAKWSFESARETEKES